MSSPQGFDRFSSLVFSMALQVLKLNIPFSEGSQPDVFTKTPCSMLATFPFRKNGRLKNYPNPVRIQRSLRSFRTSKCKNMHCCIVTGLRHKNARIRTSYRHMWAHFFGGTLSYRPGVMVERFTGIISLVVAPFVLWHVQTSKRQ